jgi:hypothetical protein
MRGLDKGTNHKAFGAGHFFTTQRPGGTETSMHGHEQIYAPPSGTTMPQQRAAMRQHIGQFERDVHRSLHPLAHDGTLRDP